MLWDSITMIGGRERQAAAELREHVLEHRDDEHDDARAEEKREDEHHDRVGHRRLDLGTQVRVRLVHLGDPVECVVEETTGLAGTDHAHHEHRELIPGADIALRERGARLHVGAHLADRARSFGFTVWSSRIVQRPHQGKPGGGHRRELAREDRQVLQLGLAAEPGDLDVLA